MRLKRTPPRKIQPLPFGVYWGAAIALCIVGICVCVYLAVSHYRIHTDVDYHSFCALSKSINCDTVSQSPFAVLWGLPLAVWGLAAYISMLILVLLSGVPSAERRRVWAIGLAAACGCSLASFVFAGQPLEALHEALGPPPATERPAPWQARVHVHDLVVEQGDVVGSPGRELLTKRLMAFRHERKIDFVVGNVENATDGSGVSLASYKALRAAGIDVCTTGDHVFKRADVLKVFEREPERLLRPHNYPKEAAGRGSRRSCRTPASPSP